MLSVSTVEVFPVNFEMIYSKTQDKRLINHTFKIMSGQMVLHIDMQMEQ